jgi:hypothetical protein
MITHSGRFVWPNGGPVTPTAPSLDDIAIGLGRTARFAGQTQHWYPVLAHTLVVARLVEPEHQIHALLHDAPEAIVGDVPTTWKTQAARDHEEELIRRIYAELDLDLPDDTATADVKQADQRALLAEAHVLAHDHPPHMWDAPDELAVRETRHEFRFCRRYLRVDAATRVYAWNIDQARAELGATHA